MAGNVPVSVFLSDVSGFFADHPRGFLHPSFINSFILYLRSRIFSAHKGKLHPSVYHKHSTPVYLDLSDFFVIVSNQNYS